MWEPVYKRIKAFKTYITELIIVHMYVVDVCKHIWWLLYSKFVSSYKQALLHVVTRLLLWCNSPLHLFTFVKTSFFILFLLLMLPLVIIYIWTITIHIRQQQKICKFNINSWQPCWQFLQENGYYRIISTPINYLFIYVT